jgi:formate dehydrogenase major subunit
MALVSLVINGKTVTAESDKTILTVARENGITNIPTLCHDGQLEPFSSCYLCVVRVKGARTLVPSCATKVTDGMVVETANDEIRASRKAALELILSNHYADCIGPCQLACPAGVDIQGYLALASLGKYEEAIQLIKQDNPLPAICGRVCTRPCEVKGCRRNLLDEPVGIDFIKRYLADMDLGKSEQFRLQPPPSNGNRVAVVGGGPAGLSAAHYLALRGYPVDIFESLPEAGGMLRYGIPEYRLPKDILDQEIRQILDLGVKLNTGRTMGKDFSIASLKEEGYKAIFLGIGAWESSKMRVENENTPGVLPGIDFLKNLGMHTKPELHGTVLVVGAGNTAIDCARTSRRLGTKEVRIVYRRTRKEMPANAMEIEEAEREGVKFDLLVAPLKVVSTNGRVSGLECQRMELGEPDASGRRSPKPVPGSEFVIPCDFVIAAIGQNTTIGGFLEAKDQKFLPAGASLNLTKWKTVEVREGTFETSIEGVFSGGDVVTGAATAIEAIAAGRKAANAIDSYLTTGAARPEPWEFNSRKDAFHSVSKADLRPGSKDHRHEMPMVPVGDRLKGFSEVEIGYSPDDVLSESNRCLGCGCQALYDCYLRKYATEYHAEVKNFLGEVKEYKLDQSHPLIELDPNKCILCGRCIRICSEVVGINAYGFINRGFNTVVKPALGMSLLDTECVSCGLCVDTCPTGAIEEKSALAKAGPWQTTAAESICQYCGVGCTLSYDVFSGSIVKLGIPHEGTSTDGNHCRKGRFGYNFIQSKDRLKRGRIRNGRGVQNTTIDETVAFTASHLSELRSRYDASQFAVFISPRLSNEEIYLAQKFARTVLRTNNVSSFSGLLNPEFATPEIVSTTTYHDVAAAEAIVIINSDTAEEHFVLDLLVKKALRKGSRLIYIGPRENRVSRVAAVYIPCDDGKQTDIIQQIQHTMAGNQGHWHDHDGLIKQAAGIIGEARTRVLLFNKDYRGLRTQGDNRIIASAASAMGCSILALREKSNMQGLCDMGVSAHFLPGYIPTADRKAVDTVAGIWKSDLRECEPPKHGVTDLLKQQKIKVVVVFGEDPFGHKEMPQPLKDGLMKAEFLVAGDAFMTATTQAANVAIPLSVIAETSGTVTSHERRVQSFRQAVPPAAEKESWRILCDLAAGTGAGAQFAYSTTDDIFDEIRKVAPIYRDVKPGDGPDAIWNLKLFKPPQFLPVHTAGNRSMLPKATLGLDHIESRFEHWYTKIVREAEQSLHGIPVHVEIAGSRQDMLEKLNAALGIEIR